MINREIKLNEYNYYMKKFLRLFISILLFFNANYYSKVALAIENNELSIDYLKKTTTSNDYILDAGDEIYITLSRENLGLNKRYTVNRDGTIYLPRLKRTYVAGLTITELSNLLLESYSEYFINPEVLIEIASYRPIKVYVKGEVDTPGIYTFEGSCFKKFDETEKNIFLNSQNEKKEKCIASEFPSIFDVIRKAGGVNMFSDLGSIELIRKNTQTEGGGQKKAEINFLEYIEGNNQQNIEIFDEDIIIVKRLDKPIPEQINSAIRTNLNPKFINILVAGRVENPGQLQVTKTSTLTDAMLVAGIKALKGKVKFVRYNSDGSVDKRIFKYRKNENPGNYKNPYLKSGDIILVGKSKYNVANEVISEITSPFLGIFTTYSILEDIL